MFNLTQEKADAINAEFIKIRRGRESSRRISVIPTGAGIIEGGVLICSVGDLNDLIRELNELKQAISDVTGIC